MDTRQAPRRRFRTLVLLAAALLGGPALAGGPACVLEANINPGSLDIPDVIAVPGGGWAPNAKKLNASASKPDPKDGGLYSWVVTQGPAGYTLANATTPQPTFTPADVGPDGATYIVRLTITGCGSSTFLDYVIRVTDANPVVANNAPHASASATPDPALEGESVLLDGTASYDPDGNALSYAWVQTGGPAVVLTGANSAQAGFIAPNVAATTTFRFQLTVSDGSLTDAAIVDVNVAWTNDPPVAHLSCPLEVDEGQPVTLDGSASADGDDGIASYAWSQKSGDPTVPDVDTWTSASPIFAAPPLGFRQTGLIGFVLTVTDASGASSSADCDLMVRDVTAPLVSVADIQADADSAAGANVVFAPAPSAFDAVDGDLTYKLACAPPSGSLFAMGGTPVACSVADSASNTGTGSFLVTVADLSPPTIAAHGDYSLEATGPLTPVDYGVPATSDKVDGAGVATCVPPPGLFAVGATRVDCSATDKAGNAAVPTSFLVTVHDTTPPAITVPADITAEATGPAGAVVNFTATASDLVSGSVPVDCTPASGSAFGLAPAPAKANTTPVSCSATDGAGNSATEGFNVTVQDTTPPAITSHADVVVYATADSGAIASWTDPTATDLVDGSVAVDCVQPSGSLFHAGEDNTITCTATDGRGNAASSTFKVYVRYAFGGFYRPIDNLPTVNVVKAGQAIPVKFSLGGDQGLAVFAAGSPKSVAMACSGSATDAIEETVTAGASTLQYDAGTGQYIYVWKTDKAWGGTCRQLQVKFKDGTTQVANFSFTR